MNIVKIADKEYKLKITLGFYKNLSFRKEEIATIYSDATRLYEVIRLAIYYGNKQVKGWTSPEDVKKEISDEVLDEIDDCNFVEKIDQAILDFLPDSLKKKIEENGEQEEAAKKK